MPTEHSHIMGGSTAAQRINCPGSLALEKEMPEKAESDFTKRGTLLHVAMELLITEDPADMAEAEPLLVQLIGQDLGFGAEWRIDEEMIADKLRPALEAWFTVRDSYDLEDWFIEQKVSLEGIIPGAFGTADIIAKDTQNRLHILDWKFGDGVPVPVKGNLGLTFYAAAALYDTDEEMVEFCQDISGVVLHVVQPRVGGDPEDVLQSWETTNRYINQFLDQAERAMTLAQAPDAPLKTGSWCRWCRAKVVCPAQQLLASEALSQDPKTMTGTDLAHALHTADQLKAWIASVYELAQTELEGGASIPGYKLVNKQPRRVWAVTEEEVVKKLKGARLKVGQIFERKVISPTKLEKLDKKLYSRLAPKMVSLHSSGLTVAPDTDKRPAVNSSMALLANALPAQQSQATEIRNRSNEDE